MAIWGCSDDGLELFVEVRTDVLPGVEFETVETIVTVGDVSRTVTTRAVRADDYVAGVRVAEVGGLPIGQAIISATLLDASEVPVVGRDARTLLEESRAITLVITRTCRGVPCGENQTCHAGACVDDRCGPDNPMACGTQECTTSTDCVATSACADVTCVEGACLQVARDERCAASERCSFEMGCVPDAPPVDSGTMDSSSMDTGVGDTGDADAGAPLGAFAVARIDELTDLSALDDDPTLTRDMREIFFSSDRGGSGTDDQNIWTSTRPVGVATWETPVLVAELSHTGNDGNPMLTADGLTIYLSRERQMHVATRASVGATWTLPIEVAELNVSSFVACPAPSADHLSIIFCQERLPDDFDLFISTRSGTSDRWGAPAWLDSLSTGGNDLNGYFALPGGLEFWYNSDRTGTIGGRDLWIARRSSTSVFDFETPSPVPGINTVSDEENPWISDDLRTLFFVSDRGGSKDIYVATR